MVLIKWKIGYYLSITVKTGAKMIISVLKEENEPRVALVPDSIKKLAALEGVKIFIEKDLTPMISNEEYQKSGANIVENRDELISKADIILGFNEPSNVQIGKMKKGALNISFMDPYNNRELVNTFIKNKVSSISMEMIPRTTLAQKMDALSSQASLAGYAAVISASQKLDRILPMMMTPAGTISPSRVFVIGAGVAGLQAIATAKRLGARVEAFDTRPVVEEQVQSLGGKFIKIDLGETGQTKNGYANALTDEQLKKQQELMVKHCALADIVITTAKLFGRKAPVIITDNILQEMRDGSVIVDLAVGSGGNVEGSVKDETVVKHGVNIIGIDNLPGEVAYNASQMYSSNLTNLILHFWDNESNSIKLDPQDEIIDSCLVTKEGVLVNKRLQEVYKEQS